MKKLLLGLLITAGLIIVPAVTAGATNPYFCGTTPYDIAYRAIYQYPTGSYWQHQIALYPDYYAAHNASYLSRYGC